MAFLRSDSAKIALGGAAVAALAGFWFERVRLPLLAGAGLLGVVAWREEDKARAASEVFTSPSLPMPVVPAMPAVPADPIMTPAEQAEAARIQAILNGLQGR